MKKFLPLNVCALFCLTLIASLGAFQANAQQTVTETFSTSGTYSFTVPTGVTEITVQAWGGGGAGGNSSQPGTPGNARGGGGGGGGDYASATFPVTPGATYTVVVGAGGTGAVTDSRINGQASTITGFESTILAAGGRGGEPNLAGGQPAGGENGWPAGTTTGDFVTNGISGSLGDTGIITSTFSGAGGDGGNGGTGGSAVGGASPSVPGSPGVFPGAGGSGGYTVDGGVSQPGGNGADGQIIITYECPDVVATSPADFEDVFCSQGDVNTAFNDWFNEFTVDGGCNLTYTFTPASPTAPNYCGGSITVELSITSDLESFVLSSTFTVTTNTPPEFSPTPGNLTANLPDNSCEVQVDWSTVTVIDECPIVTFTLTADPPLALTIGATETFGQFPPGVTTLVYFAEDVCGQTISHTFTVTVTDVDPPVFTGGQTADIAVDTDTDECFATVSWNAPEVTDNCFSLLVKTALIEYADGTTETFSFTNSTAYEREYPVGISTVTLSASDNDNTTTRSFNVTVTDNQAPSFTCPVVAGPYTASTDAGLCIADLSFTITDLFDNCGVQSISFTVTYDGVPEVFEGDGTFLTLNYEFEVGTSTVDVLVTDVSGLTESCSFDVIVTDNEDPDVTLTPITRSVDGDGNYVLTQADVDAIINATDNCGVVTPTIASINPNTFDCDDLGPNTVTVTVEDVNGNQVILTTTVTIEDDEDPVVEAFVNPRQRDADPGVCTWTVPVGLGQTWGVRTIANNPSDNCGVVSLVYSLDGATTIITGSNDDIRGQVFELGVTTITWTAYDSSGNNSSDSFVLTVVDNQPPTFTCPTPTNPYPMDAGECYAELTFEVTDADDNCGIDVVEYSYDGGAFTANATYQYPLGTTTVEVRVTDVNLNVATCTFDVEVIDDQNPLVVCPGPQVRDANAGACEKDVTIVFAEPTDNCGVATYTASASDPSVELSVSAVSGSPGDVQIQGTFPLGTTTVTITVTDVNGNTSSCEFPVQVDFVPLTSQQPVANTQNIIVVLDEISGTVSIGPEDVYEPTASPINSSCAFDSWSVDPSGFDCDDVGDNTVTLTVNLKDGSTYTGTATVTVENNTNPSITTQNITVQLDAAGTATITANDVIDNIVHNCPIDTEVVDIDSFDCNDIPNNPIIVTVTVTDINGNFSTATATVTVEDNLPPTLVADDITVSLDASGQVSITAMDVYNEAASDDNCGIDTNTFTLSRSTFDCSDIGTPVLVTFEGQDINGNPASDTFTVTVEDNILPDIFCIGNQTATTTVDCTYVHSGTAWDATVTDNCTVTSPTFTFTGATPTPAGPNVTLDGVVFELGVTTVIWEFTDMGGNTVSCTFDVEVLDDVPPVLVCPAPIVVTLGDETTCAESVSWPAPIPTDNCGTVTLDWPPVSSRVNSPNSWEDFTNGSGVLFHRGVNFLAGVTTITYRAVDAAGNETTCSFTVTLHTFDPPEAITQDITVYLDSSGEVTIDPIDVDNGSSIGCQGGANIADFLSLDIDTFDCDDVGDNTVTLTVTDKSGRTHSATAIVTVVDDIPPTVVTQDLTVYLDINGQASITPQEVDNGSFDNCDIVTSTMALDKSDFDCTDIGDVIVELTVYDVNGLSGTATATITVVDNLPPVITCASTIGSAITVGTATDSCTYTHEGTAWDATAEDNCGSYTLTYTLDGPITTVSGPLHSLDGQVFGLGVTTVTWHATDGTNASTGCVLVVTVEDNVPPVITLPTIAAEYLTDPDVCVASLTFTATAVDNCDTDPVITYSIGGGLITFPYDFPLGDTDVTVRAEDNDGNFSEETFTVTVVDEQPPVFVNCPSSPIVATAGPGLCSDNVYWDPISAFDNCPDPSTPITVTASFVDASGPVGGSFTVDGSGQHYKLLRVGVTTVTYTATDAEGNTSTCVFLVILHAEQGPNAIAQDITIFLDSSGQASITPADVDNGSSIGCLGAGDINNHLSLDIDSFDCSNVGVNTVVLTVTDKTGRTDSATAFVTVVDDEFPTLVVDDIDVYLDAAGNASIEASDLIVTLTDNCGTETPTVDISSFDCDDVGNPVVVTVSASDVNGNVSTATATVTVHDNVLPTVVVQNITVSLDANGQVSITPAQIDNGSSDACGIYTMTLDITDFDCDDVGVNTVVLTVEDVNGNTASQTATVTVEDDIPPVVTCPTVAAFYDTDPGECFATVDLEATATDNCGIDTIVYTINGTVITFPYEFPTGTTTVTATATDVNGLTDTCEFVIVVIDTEAPVVSNACPADLDGTVENCNSKYFEWIAPDFLDNCDGAITLNDNPTQYNFYTSRPTTVSIQTLSHPVHSATFPVGITIVYYEATDSEGNVGTCSFTVTVDDGEDPVAVAVATLTVELDDDGLASITPADVNDGSTDNCGILYKEVEPNSFTCADVGTFTVVLTVYDRTLRTATATTIVTVEDNVAPVLTVTPTVVQLNDAGIASITFSDVAAATDACGIQTETLSVYEFDCSDVGDVTVTVTAIDVNGNETVETVVVTVEDNVAPELVVQNHTVYLDDDGFASIEIADVVVSASDACGILTTTLSVDEFGCADVGIVTVVVTVTDNNNNSTVEEVLVTVVDDIFPTITCATDTFRYNDPGDCGYTADASDFLPTEYGDNCPDFVLTNDINGLDNLAGEFFPVGDTDVVWTITDASGNAVSCTITVTVEDNEDPTFVTFPDDKVRDVASIGNCSLLVSWDIPEPDDNCGIETMTFVWETNNSTTTSLNIEDDGPGKLRATFPAGTTTITYTVVDIHGNSHSQSFSITILDKDDPIAIAQDLDVYLDNDGLATITADQIDNGSSDICGDVFLSVSPDTFTCADVDNPVVVTLTVTDLSGNVAIATSTVYVYDDVFPTIACVTDTYRVNDPTFCTYTVQGAEFDPDVWDNCPDYVVTNDLNGTSTLAGEVLAVGDTEVIWTITDASGNAASCTITITVEDTEPPTIAAVADMDRFTDEGECTYTVEGAEFDPASFADNCGTVTITNDYNNEPTLDGAVFAKGTTTVMWTATDGVGLTATTTFEVTIIDNELPSIACATDTFRYNDPGECFYTAQLGEFDPVVDDNCNVDTVTNTYNGLASLDGEEFPVGDTIVTWYVTDTSGNTNSCTMTITVEDNEAPVFTEFPATVPHLPTSSTESCFQQHTWDNPVAEDNCDPDPVITGPTWISSNPSASIVFTEPSAGKTQANFPIGTTTITYVVTDFYSNVHTQSFSVTVDDGQDPVISACPVERIIEGCTVDDIFDPVFSDVMTLSSYDVFSDDPNFGAASDNCEIAEVWYQDEITEPSCEIVVERTWYIVDFNGRTVTCVQTIRIDENQPPFLVGILPGGDVGNVCFDDKPEAPATASITMHFEDNCTATADLVATLTNTVVDGDDCGWTVTYTYTVEDECGNITLAHVVYTGADVEPPSLVTPTITADSQFSESGLVLCLDEAASFDPVTLEAGIADLYVDNCGVVSVSYDETIPGINNSDCDWIFTYVFIVSDECFNTVTTTVTRSGGDTDAPSLIAGVTIPGGDVGNVCINDRPVPELDDIRDLYEDNCTATASLTVTLSNEELSGNNCGWTVTYTYSIQDACGNFAPDLVVVFTGADTEAPVVDNKPGFQLAYSCTDDVPAANENSLVVTDNCATTFTYNWVESTIFFVDCPNTYILTRTWTVTDQCGNTTVFDQVFTVLDDEPPALIADDCSTLNEDGVEWCYDELLDFDASTIAPDVAALYIDNCGVVTATWLEAETLYSGTDCGWTATFTFEISDECGNTVTCNVVYTGGNTEPPTLVGTIPDGETDMNVCFANIPAGPTEQEIADLFTVKCGDVIVEKSGEPIGDDCAWIVTYTYTVKDECDQEIAEPVVIVYSGGDNEPPALVGTVPTGETGMNLCFNQIPEGPTAADIAALFTDNCGVVTVTKSGTPTGDDCSWTVTYDYVIEDECGNYADPISITYSGGDNEAPQLIGTITQTVFADLNLCFENIPAGPTVEDIAALFTDNCGDVIVNKSGEPVGDDCSWIVTYTFTVEDECGNFADPIVFVYSGGDDEAPVLADPGSDLLVGDTDMNLCFDQIPAGPTAAEIAALFTDNCGVVTVTKSGTPTGDDCSWTVTYNYVIEDECGNFADPINITFSGGDDEPPTLVGTVPTGATDMNLCFDQIPEGPTAEEIAALFTDNCGVVTVTKSGTPSGDDCNWTVTYNYVIEDECGNFATPIDITYSGGDTEAPVISGANCGATEPIQVTIVADCEYVAGTEWDVTATDNCGPVTLSVELSGATVMANTVTETLSGTVFAPGLTTILWTAEDACGNIVTCTFDVMIDVGPPTFVTPLPGDKVVDVDDSAVCTYTHGDTSWDMAVIDPCDQIDLTYELTGATVGTGTSLENVEFNCGVTYVTWTAIDTASLLSSTHTYTVTVQPTDLSGYVTYYRYDAADTPLEGFIVELLDADDGIVATTTTDATGYYVFDQVDVLAAASIRITSNLPHGGLSSGDAYAVRLASLLNYPEFWGPTGDPDYFKFLNRVGTVRQTAESLPSIVDALQVYQRHFGGLDMFVAGNWAFMALNDNTLFETSGNGGDPQVGTRSFNRDFCKMDVVVRPYGDVRGTYPFGGAKSQALVGSNNVTRVNVHEVFELPVEFNQKLEYNAVSFYLAYDTSKLEIVDVTSDNPNLGYLLEEGMIRVEWYDLNSQVAYPGDAFITLIARTRNHLGVNDQIFSLGEGTEFIDSRANVIPDVEILINGIVTRDDEVVGITDPDASSMELNAFPNPFRDQLTLNYSIDVPGHVRVTMFSLTGAIVAELVNEYQEVGKYVHELNTRDFNLEYGPYILRMEVQTRDKLHSKRVTLIYTR